MRESSSRVRVVIARRLLIIIYYDDIDVFWSPDTFGRRDPSRRVRGYGRSALPAFPCPDERPSVLRWPLFGCVCRAKTHTTENIILKHYRTRRHTLHVRAAERVTTKHRRKPDGHARTTERKTWTRSSSVPRDVS